MGAAVRALSSHMSNSGSKHWNSMNRLVGFIKRMELKGIRFVEPERFQSWSLADTDYANCKETRRSVGCSFITIGGWRSTKQSQSVPVKQNIKNWQSVQKG